MSTFYLFSIILIILISVVHLVFISFRYSKKLTPILINEKTDWDPNTDRLKLVLTVIFYLSPLYLLNTFLKHPSDNHNFNIVVFSLLFIVSIFCLWFDIKKIDFLTLFKEDVIDDRQKKGRKNISLYKFVALKYLLEVKFFSQQSEYRKYNSKSEFSKSVAKKNKGIKDPKTLSNMLTQIELENLDTIFKQTVFQKYIPLLLEDNFIKEKPIIVEFLKKFHK